MYRNANIHVAMSILLIMGCSAGSRPGLGVSRAEPGERARLPNLAARPARFRGTGGLTLFSGGGPGVDAATGTDGSIVPPGGPTLIDDCGASNTTSRSIAAMVWPS